MNRRPTLKSLFDDLAEGDADARELYARDPDGYLADHGFGGLPAELVPDALVSYADTAPLEVADHLSPYVMANSPIERAEGDEGVAVESDGLSRLATVPAGEDGEEPDADDLDDGPKVIDGFLKQPSDMFSTDEADRIGADGASDAHGDDDDDAGEDVSFGVGGDGLGKRLVVDESDEDDEDEGLEGEEEGFEFVGGETDPTDLDDARATSGPVQAVEELDTGDAPDEDAWDDVLGP